MKAKIRRGCLTDLDGIYDLHKICFDKGDWWYKNYISQYISKSIVIEQTETNNIIGVLLQGLIMPCDENDDNFIPVDNIGISFKESSMHKDPMTGIIMLCVHPDFRGKGLASKLIDLHLNDNKGEAVCLNTRKSNPAFNLYLKKGYQLLALVKEKYFFPSEDSCFMVNTNN